MVIKIKPWIQSVIDCFNAVHLLKKTNLENKNRFALILLDTTLEMAFKDYLGYVAKEKISKADLEDRVKMIGRVKSKIDFEDGVWADVDFFHHLRNTLYHEKSAATILDSRLIEFEELVAFIARSLFGVEARDHIAPIDELLGEADQLKVPINSLKSDIEVLLVAVKECRPTDAYGLQNSLKRLGYRGTIEIRRINAYLSKRYSHLFFFDESQSVWFLSDEGERRYAELAKL